MKPKIPHAFVALVAAAAIPFAYAQATPPAAEATPPASVAVDAPTQPLGAQTQKPQLDAQSQPLDSQPQQPGAQPQQPQAPVARAPASAMQPPEGLVPEPVASASRTEGPGADVAKAVVDALNADASMKHSKITVLPEDDGVLLTGVTLTLAQTKRAAEIATMHVGGGKVANAIQTTEPSLAAQG